MLKKFADFAPNKKSFASDFFLGAVTDSSTGLLSSSFVCHL